jgi:phage-related protein (TIGR01555 family)
MRIFDGLVNLVSGMGTARDKGARAEYVLPAHDPVSLHAAYKASALVRRAVDLPAEDSCREWREWQAEGADISLIEAEEQRLDVVGKVYAARQLARLFGGAAIIIGTGDADPSKPLDPARIKKGGLKYLTVLSLMDVTANQVEREPASPNFGKPVSWQMAGGGITLHPSRLVIFHGIPPMAGGVALDGNTGWGDSVLPGMLDALKRPDETASNINSLVYEAKVDVFKIPGLMENLARRGQAYSDEVVKRLQLAAVGKGISGSLIMDAAEEYEQKSASFAGLPDILDRAMQMASAHAGIPMALLFGMSPAGMNATGESDIRTYYDRVRVQQTLAMQPAMSILDECLIRSALGDRPDDLHYNWRPLWQPTAKERAENADKMMSAFEKLNNMSVVPPEAIGKAAVTGLTESGAAPGLEGYVAEYFEPSGDDGSDDPVRPGDVTAEE